MNKIIEEEQKYLENTEKAIESEIENLLKKEQNIKEESTKLSFEDRLRGTHFNLNSTLFVIGENIYKLEKSKESPYFGRFDYEDLESKKILPIYIGKNAISNNSSIVVYDWRSPICELYYDSEIGPVSYNSPSGIQKGNLLLKRQILIENRKLINAIDSNLVTDDELLIPYLNINANNRMKDIIASIQKEQNAIIRANNENIIVQGVAGSGKTSVALHRIAYLIYTLNDKKVSNNFLVIGPNDYFLDYVSSVLPDLETTPVEQKTLLNFMNEYMETNLVLCENILSNKKEVEEMQKRISAFKGSLEYRDLLDKCIKKYTDGNEIVKEGFKIDGKTVYSAEQIRNSLMNNFRKSNLDNVYKKYKEHFKENIDDIYDKLNEEYRNIYISMSSSNPLRKEYVEKSSDLKKLVYNQGEKLLNKYFKSFNKSCLSLYVDFIANLDTEKTSLTEKEIKLLQKESLKAIRKKQILFEDIAGLLYLSYKFADKKTNYKNIVIDEAQDYSIFTYYTLRRIFENAKFNIYGDIAQSIYPHKGIQSWDELNKNVFDNKCNLLELQNSYRTTIQVTEVANDVLNELNLNLATPTVRTGPEIEFVDNSLNKDIKIETINNWIKTGYKTIAVICKDEIEAQKVHEELTSKGIPIKYISSKDSSYTGDISILSVASSKGLEFDCVLINDASSDVYNSKGNIDMHLLYVAVTRALHEEIIIYNKEITNPLKKRISSNKVLKRKKIDK